MYSTHCAGHNRYTSAEMCFTIFYKKKKEGTLVQKSAYISLPHSLVTLSGFLIFLYPAYEYHTAADSFPPSHVKIKLSSSFSFFIPTAAAVERTGSIRIICCHNSELGGGPPSTSSPDCPPPYSGTSTKNAAIFLTFCACAKASQ